MSTMGGSCSTQRRRIRSQYNNRHISSQQNIRMCSPGVVHSVESELPDGSISDLYPMEDNYLTTSDNRRSPKSLVELCIDQVCRSLPDLDGELPPGLPEDLVHAIVKSLVDHAALNATTLKALRNCELGKLSLAGCRGVRDDWLQIFSHVEDFSNTSSTMNASLSSTAAASSYDMEHIDSFPSTAMDMDDGNVKKSGIDFDNPSSRHQQYLENDSTSSRSTSSFVTASSSLCAQATSIPKNSNQITQLDLTFNDKNSSFTENNLEYLLHENPNDINVQQKTQQSTPSINNQPPFIASTLKVLDLCGSQRITDRGLLQLHNLTSLEVAKLDNCHSITGRGLVVFSNSNRLHTISLVNCRRLTDEAIVNISYLSSSLEALVLDGCRCLTDRSLMAISCLTLLRKLDLSQCDLFTNEAIQYLRPLELLEELYLGWCRNIGNIGLKELCCQPQRMNLLKVLRLARCPITDDGCKFLTKLNALEELDLNGCNKIGSEVLGNTLEILPNLKVLDVSYCPGILRISWQNKIKSLKSLFLNYSGVRDVDLARLVNLPALEELNLDSCPVGDWAITHFADNNVTPNLTSLDLADTDLTDSGMAHLPKFKNITRLSLFYCSISNIGLEHMAAMHNLEVLNLDSRDIGDEGLVYLTKLKKLRCLDLFSGRVTDIGCSHLSLISSLESLELCGGGITDFGCMQLAKLENLTSLNLSQNERITNRGAVALAALSNLRALNLSNTKVTSSALRFLGALSKLQSLALYGCQGVDDVASISLLQNELPSLKCLRLNGNRFDDRILSENVEEESEDNDYGEDQSMISMNSSDADNPEGEQLWEDPENEYSDDESNSNSDDNNTEMNRANQLDDGNMSDEDRNYLD